MSKAVPWSIKGVDFDAREAAKEAAGREGLSLGEWMNRAITDYAVEKGEDSEGFDADDRLEAVAAQLARLSHESENRARKRQGVERPRRALGWDEEIEPPRKARPRAQRPVAEPQSRGLRDSDAEMQLEKAVAAFEARAERAEARAARTLADVAERIDSAESERVGMLAQVENRLADLETHLRTKSRAEVEPLRGALGRLESRIEDLAQREPDTRDDETLRKLDRKLSHLLTRVERAESAPAAERDEHFSRLEKRFDALLARLDRPAPRAPAPERRDMNRAVAEIAAHQRALDSDFRPASRAASIAPAPVAPPAADPRFDMLASKLERLVELNAAPREDRRIDTLQTGIESLSSRIEDMRREFSRAQSGPARDSQAPAVEKALRDLASRIDAMSAAQPANVLKDVSGLRGDLAGLTRSLGDLAPRGAVAALESAMRDLSNRVDSTRTAFQRVAEAPREPAFETEEITRKLGEITRGLHDVAPRGAVAGIESAMRELSNRMESTRTAFQRIAETQEQAQPDAAEVTRKLGEIMRGLQDVAPRGAVANIENAVRELSSNVESARSVMERAVLAPGGGASVEEIESLGRQVTAMGRALEEVAPRSQIAALEIAVRDLSDRIERSRDEGLRDTLLAPIEHLASDVRRALAETGASANFEGVVLQMHALEDKIDDLRRSGGADRSDFLRACDQSDALRESIATALERMAPLERMEKQVASLTDRLETLSRQSHEARSAQEHDLALHEANWRDIGARLDDIALRIDRAADQRPDPAPVDSHRFDELSNRLDFMHQALAERIDGATAGAGAQPQSGLEPLLRALADKLESAMAPQADSRAIDALERQMAQVSDRLERGAADGANQLQQALALIAARLDQQHDTAREVARETLREAMAHLPQGEGLNEQARSEIAELREKAANSDRRAQQTLSAVHETLEKVVDRLAMLEEDVQDVRRAPAPVEFSHAASAPAYATLVHAEQAPVEPAPRREAAPAAAPMDFDADSLLMEPGAGRPAQSMQSAAPARVEPELSIDEAHHAMMLSPEDHAAASAGSQSSNYIEVARRALAARAAVEAQEHEQRAARGAGAATKETVKEAVSGAAKFIRPLGSGEKRSGGARTGVLLAAGASVLAMGMLQLYRVATAPYAPGVEAVEPAKPSANAAVQAPAPQPQAAAPAPVEPAPAAQSPAAQAPAAAAPSADAPAPAQPAVKAPGKGASLLDPLAVSSITPRNANMAAIQANAQASSLKDMAEKGDAAAQFDLASRYAEGRGFDRDPANAIEWFEKAAAQGQAQAQYRLGVIYEKGIGVARDARKAQANYAKAAAQGHVRAMHNLAVIEAEGVDGKPDYAAAAQWFRRGAEYGVRDSQFNLAILYARGMGVSQNMAQSWVWFDAAAQQGDSDAAKKRDEVGGRLSASELEAARKQAAAFKPRPSNPAVNEAPVASARPQTSAKS